VILVIIKNMQSSVQKSEFLSSLESQHQQDILPTITFRLRLNQDAD